MSLYTNIRNITNNCILGCSYPKQKLYNFNRIVNVRMCRSILLWIEMNWNELNFLLWFEIMTSGILNGYFDCIYSLSFYGKAARKDEVLILGLINGPLGS